MWVCNKEDGTEGCGGSGRGGWNGAEMVEEMPEDVLQSITGSKIRHEMDREKKK